MEYDIIYSSNIEKLISLVNECIQQGYIPQGGVSVNPLGGVCGDEAAYYQAMIKLEDKDD